MSCRLGYVALGCLALDLLFWFTADFSKFVPPCDGPFAERALFAGVTAAGPFAMVINGHFSDLVSSLAITAGLCAGLVAVALVGRRSLLARFAGYCGVLLWFFLGFCVAGLRIT